VLYKTTENDKNKIDGFTAPCVNSRLIPMKKKEEQERKYEKHG